MWPENIISIPAHKHSRCIYHAPTVLLKALDLEFRPIMIPLEKISSNGILRHWHKDAYEFNDAVLYGDLNFSDIVYHYKRAKKIVNTEFAPIILVDNTLVDGAHRLLAELLSDKKNINAISLSWDEFEYILSEIKPIYKEFKTMPNKTDNDVLAINTATKQIELFPFDNVPDGWVTDIPDVNILKYVNYVSGKWVPDRDILFSELRSYLRLKCRTLSKEPIDYLDCTFYFGKYELTSMLTELAAAYADDTVLIPDCNDNLVQLSISELKNLLSLYNKRNRDLCDKMTSIINHAKELNDKDLIDYCVDIFNNPLGV